MTLGQMLRTYVVATLLFFFGLLGLLYLAAWFKGTFHEPTRYERVTFADEARVRAEREAWGDGPPGTWADRARTEGRAKERKERAVRDPATVGQAGRWARCHGPMCSHDVRGEARRFLPSAD